MGSMTISLTATECGKWIDSANIDYSKLNFSANNDSFKIAARDIYYKALDIIISNYKTKIENNGFIVSSDFNSTIRKNISGEGSFINNLFNVGSKVSNMTNDIKKSLVKDRLTNTISEVSAIAKKEENQSLYSIKDTGTNSGSSSGSSKTSSDSSSSSTTSGPYSADTVIDATYESEDESDFLTEKDYKNGGYSKFEGSNTYKNQDVSKSKITLLRSVYGMPYQFLPDTDRRLFSNKNKNNLDNEQYMGRKYIERIAQRSNILFITPGEVKFLKGASSDLKAKFLKGFISGNDTETMKKAFLKDNESYKYYSFDFDITGYWYYLNPMIRAAAKYLKLDKKYPDGINFGTGKTNPTTANYYEIFGKAGGMNNTLFSNAFGALTFYLDNANDSSDSISTSLTGSSLAEKLNSFGDTARELNFLVGKGVTDFTNKDWANNLEDPDKVKEAMTQIDNFVATYLKSNNFARRIGLGAATIATGGQIIFPKIWSDTNFDTENVNCTIKLTSPNADDFSIFYNILIPMYAILCLAAPHGNPGIDGYSAPFPVRAFCQSMFNIECGYITSLSLRRGGEGYWTASGLPTSLEINITITDVYDSRYISTAEKNLVNTNPFKIVKNVAKKTDFLKNTTMLNWIAMSCGVNLNKPDLIRDIEMYLSMAVVNPVTDVFTNFTLNIFQTLRNMNPTVYDLISGIKNIVR